MSTVNNRYSIEPTQRAQSLDKSPNNISSIKPLSGVDGCVSSRNQASSLDLGSRYSPF